jgi:hypothetical protein
MIEEAEAIETEEVQVCLAEAREFLDDRSHRRYNGGLFSLEGSKDQLRRRIVILQKAHTRATHDNEDLINENNKLKRIIEDRDLHDHEDLIAENNKLSRKIEGRDRKIARRDTRIGNFEVVIDELRAELQEANEDRAQMKQFIQSQPDVGANYSSKPSPHNHQSPIREENEFSDQDVADEINAQAKAKELLAKQLLVLRGFARKVSFLHHTGDIEGKVQATKQFNGLALQLQVELPDLSYFGFADVLDNVQFDELHEEAKKIDEAEKIATARA